MPPPAPGAEGTSSILSRTTFAPIFDSERTSCKLLRFDMKWTIHGFLLHHKFKASLYNTGVSMTDLGLDDYEGRWRIRFGGSTSNNPEAIYVYLVLTDVTEKGITEAPYSGARDIPVKAKVRVTTGLSADTVIMEGTIRQTFNHKKTTWGLSVITYALLFGSNEQPGKLDGCITITMQVTLTLQENVFNLINTGQREFAQRQLQWADSGHQYDTDFVLRSMDGKKFFTNPFLLAAHSPVFAAMLNHDTKEKRTMCCEMEDVDGETVAIVVDYLYGCETGKLNGQNAERVFIMADKYQLMNLRSVTEQILTRNITIDNAVHGLRFANLHKLEGLKGACLKVIDKNMGTVLSDEELVRLDPETMKVILAHCAEKARLTVKSVEF